MANFDYDVVIIGSGFGGSVAALRAAEKGYRVGVMESGRRWNDEDIPKTNWDLKHYLWFPGQSCTGFKGSSPWTMCSCSVARALAAARMSMATPCMSLRSNSSTRRDGRVSPTGPTNWRLATTRQGGCSALFATRTCPPTSIATCSRSRSTWGEGETFNKAPVGVYFGSPVSKPTIPIWRDWTAAYRMYRMRQLPGRLRPQRQEQGDDELPLFGGKARRRGS